ncbi:hypothetical protein [Marinobacterium weihaiense]|uniref:Flagellar protein FliO/FliZ n=1 Tax=Marinobacterium weihaiense TaxID=2851016 RepID=A0ABS6MBR4_9GAMM|nr:hypothetical protein [Marinobacterium weihaiense]MBV0933152.1 hypothetical protein [Marinobacterium weihaiense]
MTTRVFHVSPGYRRRQQARQLAWMLAMLGLVLFSLYYLYRLIMGNGALAEMLVPVVGVAACLAYAVKLWLQLRQGRAAYPEVCWDEDSRILSLQAPEGALVLPLASVLNLRIQVGGGRVVAATLTTESGEQLRLEGYAELDELVGRLEAELPEGQVVRTRLRY